MTVYRYFSMTAMSVILACAPIAAAHAQVENATRAADPGRVQQQLMERENIPDVTPSVEVENMLAQKAPPGAEDIKFTLRSVQLDGVSAYKEGALASVYQDELGQVISLADLYQIAAELTNKFRNDGYILTQVVVPPQTIEGGNVHLQVVEGYVDRVVVEGNGVNGLDLIRSYANNIRTGKALNVSDLERYLLLINDLPGVEARSVLSPSPNKTGAADLRIIATRDPFDALLAADNFGSRYLGPLELTGAAVLNSAFGINEKITAQAVLAPQLGDGVELGYGMLAYEQPIFNKGTTVEALVSVTETNPGFDLKPFDVEGISRFASLKVKHPFIRSRSQNLYGDIGFDARNLESSNSLESEDRRDHIRAVRVGARYELLDTLFGVGINSADLVISKGVDWLGASDEGDTRLTRLLGDPTFTKANLELQRLQHIVSNVNLLVAATGQWANNPLLSSEEFGVGGISYGRGYDPSEITGDDGVAAKVELQWNDPVKIQYLDNLQLYSFYDFGKVWNKDATTLAGKIDSLASVGFGARTDVFDDSIEAGAGLAFPLTREVQTEDGTRPRLYLNISKKF